MNGKVPPHNEDAERSVLGAGLLSRDALSDTLELIEEEDFYNKSNAAIFHVMKEMYIAGKPIDIVTVCDELKRRDELDAVGGRSYVA